MEKSQKHWEIVDNITQLLEWAFDGVIKPADITNNTDVKLNIYLYKVNKRNPENIQLRNALILNDYYLSIKDDVEARLKKRESLRS